MAGASDLEDAIRELEDMLVKLTSSGGDPSKIAATSKALDTMRLSLLSAGKNASALAKSLEDSTKGNLDWLKTSKNLNKETQDTIRQLKNSSSSYEEFSEKLKKYAEDVSKGLDPEQERVIKQNIEATGKLSYKQEEYGKILDEVKKPLGALGTAAGNIVKSYQAGGSQIGVASSALQGGLDVITSGANVAGNAAKSTGDALANSANPKVKAFGAALSGVGAVTTAASGALSALAKSVLPILQTELQNAITSFQSISSTGAVFSGGLTEMVTMSGQAGMTLDMFGKVVSQNKEAFGESGLSMAGAAKKFSEVSGAMGDKGFKGQLLNLGYSIEEQGGLVAETFKNMQRTGRLQGASSEDIAKQSYEYGKNLRIISDMTGQDAKAKMAAAQKDMDALDVQAKLLKLQQEQPEVYDKVKAQLSVMPDSMKAGFLQMFTGETITDPATRVLMDRVPGLEKAYEQMIADANNSSMKTSDALASAGSALAGARQSMIDNAGALADIGKAARLGSGGIAADIQGLGGKLIGELAPFTDATKEVAQKVNDAASTQDKATQAMNDVIQKNIELATQIQNQVLTPNVIGEFAKIVAQTTGAVSSSISALTGEKPKKADAAAAAAESGGGITQWFKDNAKSLIIGAGTAAGGIIGGVAAGGLTAGLGAIPGAAMGAIEGASLGATLASLLGFATGGVAKGPDTGYIAKLHGDELIVPIKGSTLDASSQGYQDLLNLTGVTSIPKIDGKAGDIETSMSVNSNSSAKDIADSISNVIGSIIPALSNPFAAISRSIESISSMADGGMVAQAGNIMKSLPPSPVESIMKIFTDKIDNADALADIGKAARLGAGGITAEMQKFESGRTANDELQTLNQNISMLLSVMSEQLDYMRDIKDNTKNTADAVS